MHPRSSLSLLDRMLGDRTWLEHVPYIVNVSDRAHRLLYLNRTVPGRRAEEFVGTSIFDWMPEPEHERVRAALERAWESVSLNATPRSR